MGILTGNDQSYYTDADSYGNYQFTSLDDIISNFMVVYVGEGKAISKVKRLDVAFHAQRALQELSYDTLRSEKSQELELDSSMSMPIPRDYVNYVKVTWVDGNGVERIIQPARKTSNPSAIVQDIDYSYMWDNDGNLNTSGNSSTWTKFREATEKANIEKAYQQEEQGYGQRFGIDPQFAAANGTFFIDPVRSKIYFSSNLTSAIVTLKYISDGVATDAEMKVHKFAEEAVYKFIAYAILCAKSNVPEYVIRRYKKERSATTRQAKLRLANLKSEELGQVMRGKSKQIKH